MVDALSFSVALSFNHIIFINIERLYRLEEVIATIRLLKFCQNLQICSMLFSKQQFWVQNMVSQNNFQFITLSGV